MTRRLGPAGDGRRTGNEVQAAAMREACAKAGVKPFDE
jgi:hypothetical protein